MAWTAPRTWVAGEVATAALLNTHLRDNLNFIAILLTTGTLTNRGVLYGSATAPIGATPALGAGAIVVGGTGGTADPTTLVAFAGSAGVGAYRLKGTHGGLNNDVSAATAGELLVAIGTGTFTGVGGPSGQYYQSRGTGTVGTFADVTSKMTVLGTASGTTTVITNQDYATITISGLGSSDRLMVAAQIWVGFDNDNATGWKIQSSAVPGVLGSFGSGAMASGNDNGAQVLLWITPLNSTNIARGFGFGRAATTAVLAGNIGTVGTSWTGTWNLALRAGSLSTVATTATWEMVVWRVAA